MYKTLFFVHQICEADTSFAKLPSLYRICEADALTAEPKCFIIETYVNWFEHHKRHIVEYQILQTIFRGTLLMLRPRTKYKDIQWEIRTHEIRQDTLRQN